ncbi:MAG: hypothetical protein Q9184_002718, partial [Pyrenodesmia sp. 2 TL-2023]
MHLLARQSLVATFITITHIQTSAARLLYSRPAALNAQLALQIEENMNDPSNVIPGGSPFFYMEDPNRNLFTIESITMTPTPCQIGIPCALEAKVMFYLDFPSFDFDASVEARLPDGQAMKIIVIEDDLCEWVTLKQGSISQCPPRQGAATLSYGLQLARGWVME